ncbi:hypothetical protein MOTT12_03203 [Mycobacterium intracellulare subsp. yongonense]|nr:hypothetical protein MOTT12_03203 [Mycobacterium intracellulare subsp. yongonense]
MPTSQRQVAGRHRRGPAPPRPAPPRPGTAAAGTATARGPGPLSLGGGQNTYRFAQ